MASLIQRCLRFLISWLSTFVTRQSKRPGTTSSTTSRVSSNQRKKKDGTPDAKTNCFVCGQPRHSLFKCEKFLGLKVEERVKIGLSQRKCLCCFASGHKSDACPSSFRCRFNETTKACGANHHTLIHGYVAPGKSSDTYTISAGSSPKTTAPPLTGGGKDVEPTLLTLDVNTPWPF